MLGSWTFSKNGQDGGARFITRHKVPVDKLIKHRFKLEEGPAAYQLFDQQKMGKGMIVPG